MLYHVLICTAAFMCSFWIKSINTINIQPIPPFSNNLLDEVSDFDNIVEPEVQNVINTRESQKEDNSKSKDKCVNCNSKSSKTDTIKRELNEMGQMYVNKVLREDAPELEDKIEEREDENSEPEEPMKTFPETNEKAEPLPDDKVDEQNEEIVIVTESHGKDHKTECVGLCGGKNALDEEIEEIKEDISEKSPESHHKEFSPNEFHIHFYKHVEHDQDPNNKDDNFLSVNLYPDEHHPQISPGSYDFIALVSENGNFIAVPAVKLNFVNEENGVEENYKSFHQSKFKRHLFNNNDLKKINRFEVIDGDKLKFRESRHIPILFVKSVSNRHHKRSLTDASKNNKYMKEADLLIENIKATLSLGNNKKESPAEAGVLVKSKHKNLGDNLNVRKKDIDSLEDDNSLKLDESFNNPKISDSENFQQKINNDFKPIESGSAFERALNQAKLIEDPFDPPAEEKSSTTSNEFNFMTESLVNQEYVRNQPEVMENNLFDSGIEVNNKPFNTLKNMDTPLQNDQSKHLHDMDTSLQSDQSKHMFKKKLKSNYDKLVDGNNIDENFSTRENCVTEASTTSFGLPSDITNELSFSVSSNITNELSSAMPFATTFSSKTVKNFTEYSNSNLTQNETEVYEDDSDVGAILDLLATNTSTNVSLQIKQETNANLTITELNATSIPTINTPETNTTLVVGSVMYETSTPETNKTSGIGSFVNETSTQNMNLTNSTASMSSGNSSLMDKLHSLQKDLKLVVEVQNILSGAKDQKNKRSKRDFRDRRAMHGHPEWRRRCKQQEQQNINQKMNKVEEVQALGKLLEWQASTKCDKSKRFLFKKKKKKKDKNKKKKNWWHKIFGEHKHFLDETQNHR